MLRPMSLLTRLVGVALLSVLSAPATAAAEGPLTLPSWFRGVVQVDRAGVTLLRAAQGEGLDPEQPVWIGSVSKQMASVAALRLVASGRLELDAPAPGSPDPQCTLRRLMQHACGLPRKGSRRPYHRLSDDALRSMILDDIDDASPDPAGVQTRYSNLGYDWLGVIVGDTAELAYPDHLIETLFTPLDLAHTGIRPVPPSLPPGRLDLFGSNPSAALWLGLPVDAPSFGGAAGNVYSSVGDLTAWNKALHEGDVLPPALLEAFRTPGPDGVYAMGIGRFERDYGTVYRHQGALAPHGYTSYLAFAPAQRISVAVLSDLPLPISGTRAVGDFLMERAHGLSPTIPAAPGWGRERILSLALAALLFMPLFGYLSLILVFIRRRRKPRWRRIVDWVAATGLGVMSLTLFRPGAEGWILAVVWLVLPLLLLPALARRQSEATSLAQA